MHKITLKEGVIFNRVPVPPGTYILHDRHCGSIMKDAKPHATTVVPYVQENLAGEGILIVCAAAYGDMLMLTPALRELKRLHPSVKLDVAFHAQHHEIYYGNPFVDNLIDYPVNVETIAKYKEVYFIEDVLAMDGRANTIHGADIMAECVGLPPLENKVPFYEVNPEESRWATVRYPKNHKKRIGVSLHASTMARNYPFAQLIGLLALLVKENVEVFLFGCPNALKVASGKNVRNLTLEGLDIRQSIAALSTCDVMTGPDSLMLHVAAALNIPSVGVWATHEPHLRTYDKPNIINIVGSGCDLAPCHHTAVNNGQHFPSNCPSRGEQKCRALANIKPDAVLDALKKLLR